MSFKKISQVDARQYRKERDELQQERDARYKRWAVSSYPGTHIDTITVRNSEWHIALTARKLGHAIIVVPADKDDTLNIYAVAP